MYIYLIWNYFSIEVFPLYSVCIHPSIFDLFSRWMDGFPTHLRTFIIRLITRDLPSGGVGVPFSVPTPPSLCPNPDKSYKVTFYDGRIMTWNLSVFFLLNKRVEVGLQKYRIGTKKEKVSFPDENSSPIQETKTVVHSVNGLFSLRSTF